MIKPSQSKSPANAAQATDKKQIAIKGPKGEIKVFDFQRDALNKAGGFGGLRHKSIEPNAGPDANELR